MKKTNKIAGIDFGESLDLLQKIKVEPKEQKTNYLNLVFETVFFSSIGLIVIDFFGKLEPILFIFLPICYLSGAFIGEKLKEK